MKWFYLVYCMVSVDAAIAGILLIIVRLLTVRDRTEEIWGRLRSLQARSVYRPWQVYRPWRATEGK
jgi:hypothetical protein